MAKGKKDKDGKDLLETLAEQQKGDHKNDARGDKGKDNKDNKDKNHEKDQNDKQDSGDGEDQSQLTDENQSDNNHASEVLKVKYDGEDPNSDGTIDFTTIVGPQHSDNSDSIFNLSTLPVIESIFTAPQPTVQPTVQPVHTQIVPDFIVKPALQTLPDLAINHTNSAPTQPVVQPPVVNLFSDAADNISFGTNSISSVSAKEGVAISQANAANYTDGTQYDAGAGDDVVILPYKTGDNGGFAVNGQLRLG